MIQRLIMLITLSVTSSLAANLNADQQWQALETALIKQANYHQWIPMRDGIRLNTHIFLPQAGEAPYPTILIRSPYRDLDMLQYLAQNQAITRFLEQGYALVLQHSRGRFWSEGESSYLQYSQQDGYDTIDWLAQQPWSNGNIGTFGCSASADNQLALAVAAHPAHKAAIAEAPGDAIGTIGPYQTQGNHYRGGALTLSHAFWYYNNGIHQKRRADQQVQFPKQFDQQARIAMAKQVNPNPRTPSDALDLKSYYQQLPIIDINKAIGSLPTDWRTLSQRTPADPAWANIDLVNQGDKFGVPMLWVFSWYDLSIAANVALYNDARHNTPLPDKSHLMIISPMGHCQFGQESAHTKMGERSLGDARFAYADRYLEWFDYHLKGQSNQALERADVSYYEMGSNQWRHSNSFPVKGSHYVDYYLNSAGKANSLFGDGQLSIQVPQQAAADSYDYDPNYPVPTLGGSICCDFMQFKTGAQDQRQLETRNDILVYTSEPFTHGLNVAGFIEIELYVSSDARDTDFTVKLLNVTPDGRAYNLDDSILRARYREGFDKSVLMEKDQVYKLRFAPLITANYFQPGHRLRLEISSSNFPRYDRNLNTGGNNFDETQGVIARNQIHHSRHYPSRIRLPISSVKQ